MHQRCDGEGFDAGSWSAGIAPLIAEAPGRRRAMNQVVNVLDVMAAGSVVGGHRFEEDGDRQGEAKDLSYVTVNSTRQLEQHSR